MSDEARPTRILHLHSSFSLGGKEARATRLMNLMGDRARHTILSAVPDALGARDAIDPAIDVEFPGDAAPALHGKPGLPRYRQLARYMAGFDLVLGYNWGSMDGVMAHRLFAPFRSLPPLIHHEDGFNEDESVRRNWKRNAFRRLALPTAEALVVPSVLLRNIAAQEWGAARRTVLIRNGIDVAAYGHAPTVEIPFLETPKGAVVVGTVAGLRAVKNLPRLVELTAHMHPDVRLAIVGEGPERKAITEAAVACGWDNRFVLPGFKSEPASMDRPFRHSRAQFAQRTGADRGDRGDGGRASGGELRRWRRRGDGGARKSAFHYVRRVRFSPGMKQLVSDAALRRAIGEANRRVAAECFDESTMVAAYENLYGRALMGRRLFSPE